MFVYVCLLMLLLFYRHHEVFLFPKCPNSVDLPFLFVSFVSLPSTELSRTDTAMRKWQVDGPNHYLTLNRLKHLIPKKKVAPGGRNYSVDSSHNSISTVYNHLTAFLASAVEM